MPPTSQPSAHKPSPKPKPKPKSKPGLKEFVCSAMLPTPVPDTLLQGTVKAVDAGAARKIFLRSKGITETEHPVTVKEQQKAIV